MKVCESHLCAIPQENRKGTRANRAQKVAIKQVATVAVFFGRSTRLRDASMPSPFDSLDSCKGVDTGGAGDIISMGVCVTINGG